MCQKKEDCPLVWCPTYNGSLFISVACFKVSVRWSMTLADVLVVNVVVKRELSVKMKLPMYRLIYRFNLLVADKATEITFSAGWLTHAGRSDSLNNIRGCVGGDILLHVQVRHEIQVHE